MLITIITINYNDKKGLTKTMQSVFDQTYANIEYIVIDGGSTDGSKEYIENNAGKLTYWVSEKDKGIYNAMNKGIDKATGEYLLFLNSGDHLYSNTVLEENYIRITKYDLIYFNLHVVDYDDSFIKKYPNLLALSFLINDSLPHPATFIRRKLFDVVGYYDESLRIVSDWKFFILAIFKFNSSYLKIDKTLSSFYLDGISSDLNNRKLLFEERQSVLESNFNNIIGDMDELFMNRKLVNGLRKSKKIKLLIKLGFLTKF